MHSKPKEQQDQSNYPLVYADGALYKIVNDYLVPHYEPRAENRQLRKQELLADRVQKFFYSVKPGLDVKCTAPALRDEMAQFDALQAYVKELNPDFSFSTPYREMSKTERQLINDGASLAGHIVNRLGRLGQIILQQNKTGVDVEYPRTSIRKRMDDIKAEFNSLYAGLILGEHENLARCIISRDKRVDHDGIFSYYMHEIGKIINDDVSPYISKLEEELKAYEDTAENCPDESKSIEAQAKAKGISEQIEQRRNRLESLTRHGIVTNIGFALEAIDETATNLEVILQHPMFGEFARRTQKMIEHPTKSLKPKTNDIDIREYRGMLREYVDLCRARTCIRSEDTGNFNPVSKRMNFLESELALYHEMMFRASESTRNKTTEEGTSLLKRGVALMGEMSELRLPRNRNAPCVYDSKNPEFADRDASSVGRLAEKIQRLKEGKLQGTALEF